MNEKLAKLNLKIIIPVVMVILILIIIVVIASQKGRKAEQNTSNTIQNELSVTPENNQSSTSTGTIPTETSSNQQSKISPKVQPTNITTISQVFNGTGYTVNFPGDWRVQSQSYANQNIDIFTQILTMIVPTAPSLKIITIQNSTQTLEARENLFMATTWAKETRVSIAGTQAVQLSIETPAPVINGQSYGAPMEVRYIYLEHNNAQYELNLTYQSGKNDDNQLLNSIVQTFVFH